MREGKLKANLVDGTIQLKEVFTQKEEETIVRSFNRDREKLHMSTASLEENTLVSFPGALGLYPGTLDPDSDDLVDGDDIRIRDLLNELNRYLWVRARSHERFPPPLVVDALWHAFLLCTELYHDYCIRSFGRIIHHDPFQPAMSQWVEGADDINPFAKMNTMNEQDKRKFSTYKELLDESVDIFGDLPEVHWFGLYGSCG